MLTKHEMDKHQRKYFEICNCSEVWNLTNQPSYAMVLLLLVLVSSLLRYFSRHTTSILSNQDFRKFVRVVKLGGHRHFYNICNNRYYLLKKFDLPKFLPSRRCLESQIKNEFNQFKKKIRYKKDLYRYPYER